MNTMVSHVCKQYGGQGKEAPIKNIIRINGSEVALSSPSSAIRWYLK